MPHLEYLYLSFQKTVGFSLHEREPKRVYFGCLKSFHLGARRSECAAWSRYLEFPPGCTYSMEYEGTEELSSCEPTGADIHKDAENEEICRAIMRWSKDSCLDMLDKHLELDIQPEFLCVAIHPKVSPNLPIFMLKESELRPNAARGSVFLMKCTTHTICL